MESNQSDSFYDPGDKVFDPQIFPIALACLASALIGWAVSSLASFHHTEVLAGIIAAIMSAATLTIRSITVKSRLGTMIKADCWLFFVVSMVASIGLAIWCPNPKYFFIIDGLLLVIFLSSVYKLSKTGV